MNPKVEVGGLGLVDGTESVLERRGRGGGFGAGGRVFGRYGGGGGRVSIPGERTCTVCQAAHCWMTQYSCYRCGSAGHARGPGPVQGGIGGLGCGWRGGGGGGQRKGGGNGGGSWIVGLMGGIK